MGFLRLILALSVVAIHCNSFWGINLVGGKLAVQAFYMISGFYMSLILNEKYIGSNSSYKLFITNRFLRLFPVYWVVLVGSILLSIAVSVFIKDHTINSFDRYFTVYPDWLTFLFLIISNIIIFGQDLVMFLGINPENGHLFFTSNFFNTDPALHRFLFVPQAWTLGIELMFYLVAPFILTRGIKIIAALIVLSFLLRLYIYHGLGFNNDPWTYRFFPTELIFFLFGYLAYRLSKGVAKLKVPGTINWIILIGITLLTIFYFPLFNTKDPEIWMEIIFYLAVFISIPFLFTYFKKSKFDSAIGELSYPVYISHMLVATVCQGLQFPFLRQGFVIALCTLLVSYLLNRFIADPVEKFRQARMK